MASLQRLVGAAGLGVTVKGFYTPGDFGSGDFYYDANYSGANIPGMAIRPNGTSIGGWRRKWTGKLQGGWFGIMANGINIDTAAWTAAVNFAGANKLGSIQMPNGNILGVNFTCLYDSVTIEGSGSTVLFMLPTLSTANAAGINISGRHGVTIQNLTIDCSGFQGSSAFGNIGIRMSIDTGLSFFNVTIRNNTYTGFSFQNYCYDVLVQGCHVINTDVCIHFIGSGIGSSKLRILGNEFRDGTSEAITLQGVGGISQTESIDFIISGNTISGKVNSSGIYLLYAKYGTVSNNTIFNCRAGISGSPSNVTRPDYTAHIVVTGNIIHGMINDGIGPMGNGSIVSNNILDSIGREGIQVGYYQDITRWDTAVTVAYNTLTHININKSPGWGGIRWQNLRHSKIKNNTVYLGPGQDTVTNTFAYRKVGNFDSALVFEGNIGIDGDVSSNSNMADNYIVFRHNIVRNLSIQWAVTDSFTKKAVYDNNTYLSSSINGNLQPDPTGFLAGINGFNPRTVYNVGNSSNIRVIAGTSLQRTIKLVSQFNGNTILSTGGNILLKNLVTAKLDSGKYVTLVWDGTNWNQTDANVKTEYLVAGADTVSKDTSGARVKGDFISGRIAIHAGGDDQQDDLRSLNTTKSFRLTMPQYDDPKKFIGLMSGSSNSTLNQLQFGAISPNLYYNVQTIDFLTGTHGFAFSGTINMRISQPDNAIHIGSSTASGTADIALRKTYTDVNGMGYVHRSHATFASPSGSTEIYGAYWANDSVNNAGNGIMSGFIYDPKYVASTGGQAAFYAKNVNGFGLYAPSAAITQYSAGAVNIGVSNSGGDPSAILSAVTTTQGVLFPNLTTTQKNAIATPHKGLQVFDITLNQMSYYNGTTWINF